jgi:hypothetical protein
LFCFDYLYLSNVDEKAHVVDSLIFV